MVGRFNNGSSPRKKPQQKRPPISDKEASFALEGEREGYVSGVLPLIRQVHFERTNTVGFINKEYNNKIITQMSSHATFVVENNSRRPLLANSGFDNGLKDF